MRAYVGVRAAGCVAAQPRETSSETRCLISNCVRSNSRTYRYWSSITRIRTTRKSLCLPLEQRISSDPCGRFWRRTVRVLIGNRDDKYRIHLHFPKHVWPGETVRVRVVFSSLIFFSPRSSIVTHVSSESGRSPHKRVRTPVSSRNVGDGSSAADPFPSGLTALWRDRGRGGSVEGNFLSRARRQRRVNV